MCREVIELVKNMDKADLKNQLALQCAPLFMGLKSSNLLTLRSHGAAEVGELFRGTDIKVQVICRAPQQTVLLLFREAELLAYLNTPVVKTAMARFGYRELALDVIFEKLCINYESYMRNRGNFPHELGLLLGYPVEDVLGFVENCGQNYLYCGYWKVYGNVAKAKEIFSQYLKAKEQMVRMVSSGVEITALLSARG